MCGVASRIGADELISRGTISMNGKNHDTLGITLDPE